ncbi:MAG: PorV/PorQ family protein [Elusimicrobia bacterium]|nr:PorV/PorQ family protein [Elusimicrobiota bacterium]
MKTLALLLLFAAPARGAETAAFLDLGIGARALALGGAYTALGEDAHSLYWNPAGLAALKRREAAVSHAELALRTRHDFLAFAYPTERGTFAGGLTHLSHGELEGRDALGRPTGGFEASDTAVSLAYAAKGGLADYGVAVKYIRGHIGSAEAQGVGLDAGLRRALGALTLGAALRNVGRGLKYDTERDDLPLRLAFGGAYRLTGGHALAAELVNGPRGAGSVVSIGGEYQALEAVFVRAGYTTRNVAGGSGFDAVRGLTLGMGFKNERWELSYGVLPMGELGNTHRFSLGSRF